MRRLGLKLLRNLDPKPPVQQRQWEKLSDMIHVHMKQLSRFERVGHRITADPRKGSSPGAGYEKVHVAVDVAPVCPMSRSCRSRRGRRPRAF